MRFILKKIFGVFLIILGIIGLFVPILQGLLLIAAGLAVLKIDFLKERVLKFRKK